MKRLGGRLTSVRLNASSAHRGGRFAALPVSGATLVVGAIGWLLLLVVARLLGASVFAQFAVLWGFFFAVTGLLSGMQQEITRAISVGRCERLGSSTRPLIFVALLMSLGLSLTVVVSSGYWAPNLFGEEWIGLVPAIAVGLVVYGVTVTVNASLAAGRVWGTYSIALVADAVLRLTLVVCVCALGQSPATWAWAIAGGATSWMFLLGSRPVRRAFRARGDTTTFTVVKRSGNAMVAAGCSAVLVAGFPVVMQVTNDGPLREDAGAVLGAVILTRAGVLLPVAAFQPAAVTYFVERRDAAARALDRILIVLAILAVLAAIGGLVIGGPIVTFFLGDQFRVDGLLVSGLIVAAVALGMLTLSGTALLAIGRHSWSSIGWVVATVATIVLMSVPLGMGLRVPLALTVGPICGLTLHYIVLRGDRLGTAAERARDCHTR